MKENLMALLAGLLFSLGLGLSQMIDRDRILDFLDVSGVWNPTLLFVLAGAVTVTVIAFRFVLRRSQPLLVDKFHLPTKKDIDTPLIIGAAIFGVGWGIAGYCPRNWYHCLGIRHLESSPVYSCVCCWFADL